jgi:Ca2+-binding EF-hand superfamily protein
MPTHNIPTHNIPTRNYPTRNYPTRNYPTRNMPTRNMPTHIHFGFKRFGLGIVLLALCLALSATVSAQDDGGDNGGDRGGGRRNWDPAEFLKRLDRNGDGQLSTEEMGGRSGRFIEQLGFDPSRPVAIDRVVRKIADDRKAEAAKERRKEIEANRIIPGFGDEEIELPVVPGFGEDAAQARSQADNVTGKFDEATEQTVKSIMDRYDENKDGFLAGDETRRIGRWIGGVEEADTDQDGKLSPVELGEGFRKQMQRRQSGENAGSGDSAGSNRGRSRDWGSFRSPSADSSRNSSPRASAATPATTRTLDGRMTAYVDGVFQKYDKNNDQQLDKDELTTVKVQFKDTDGNGSISREEAMDFVSSAQKTGGSVSPAYAAGKSASRESRGSQARDDDNAGSVRRDAVLSGRTTATSGQRSTPEDDLRQNGASSKFIELDRNHDGQLQMNEFADGKPWSDALFGEFEKADTNQDGVVSLEEFDNK